MFHFDIEAEVAVDARTDHTFDATAHKLDTHLIRVDAFEEIEELAAEAQNEQQHDEDDHADDDRADGYACSPNGHVLQSLG